MADRYAPVRAALSGVQGYISDVAAESWPGTSNQPQPGARLLGTRLEMWFGDAEKPVLEDRPLNLT